MDRLVAGTTDAHHIAWVLVELAVVGAMVQSVDAATAAVLATATGAALYEVF